MTMHTPLEQTIGFTWSDASILTLAQQAPPVAGRPQPATTGADSTPIGAAPGTQQRPASNPLGSFIPIMLIVVVFMIFTQTMGGKKQKKKRAAMLASLGKHDKVQTVGGMIGSICEVRDDEVIIRIDDSTNTKAHFSRSSIQQVIRQASESSQSDQSFEPEIISASSRTPIQTG